MKEVNGCLFIRKRISVPLDCIQSILPAMAVETIPTHKRTPIRTNVIFFCMCFLLLLLMILDRWLLPFLARPTVGRFLKIKLRTVAFPCSPHSGAFPED
jgi:hypothetical protein